MSTWAARAKAAISQKGLGGTAKTDKTPVFGLLAVLAVPTGADFQAPAGLSSVLAVPTPPVFEKRDIEPAANEPVATTTVQTVICRANRNKHDYENN